MRLSPDLLSTNSLARKVKLADLEHNMDVRRLESLTSADLDRLDKYHRAWLELRKRDAASGSQPED